MNSKIRNHKPKILIGFLNKDNRGAIPTITNAFIDGLKERYEFYPFYMDRSYGNTRQSNLNIINLIYFLVHFIRWVYSIIIFRPDIVHVPVTSFWNFEKSMSFLMAGKLFGCKTIGHLHGGAFYDFVCSLSKPRRIFANYCLSKADSFIVLSNSWKIKIIEMFPFMETKIVIVPNPIDKEFENEFMQFERKNDSINILSIGVMDSKKGILDILNAAKIVNNKNIKFVLVGDEREPNILKTCKDFIENNNLHDLVIISGAKWGNDKMELYKQSSIFLLPSYMENFPMVIIEAAAANMAIISTPVGALPDYFIDNYSIKYVKPGNVQMIVDAIRQLIENKEFRISIARNANETFRNKLNRTQIFASLDFAYTNIANTN